MKKYIGYLLFSLSGYVVGNYSTLYMVDERIEEFKELRSSISNIAGESLMTKYIAQLDTTIDGLEMLDYLNSQGQFTDTGVKEFIIYSESIISNIDERRNLLSNQESINKLDSYLNESKKVIEDLKFRYGL